MEETWIAGWETVDHPTAFQLVALARNYFVKYHNKATATLFASGTRGQGQHLISIRTIPLVVAISFGSCAKAPAPVTPAVGDDSHPAFIVNATPEQVEAGKAIVELQCVSCHAVRSGDKSHNPAAPPLRTLAERYPATGLAEAFAQGVLKGHPNMPDFRFSSAQIDAILAYLQSIQTRQAAALDPLNPGSAFFATGLTCITPTARG